MAANNVKNPPVSKSELLKKLTQLENEICQIWSHLIAFYPESASDCPCWDKFNGAQWVDIMLNNPEVAEHRCPREKLSVDDWFYLLLLQPYFLKDCPCWDKFSHRQWLYIIAKYPQLASQCPYLDQFDLEEWQRIIKVPPAAGQL